MVYSIRVLILLASIFLPLLVNGQIIGSREFGKNRVQYKEFDWLFYSTDNFDVYYYAGGKEQAKLAINYLEDEFDRITDLLGYAPYAKTKIFIYNSVKDLQQSNIGMNDEVFTVGGQTNFVKLQTEIPFTGTVTEFKKELLLRISRMLINDMMFGGSLADMFQSSYLLTLPQWFVEGAARYVAEGWSVEMDDYIRDLLSNENVKKLNRLEGEEGEIAGQSVWNYIANKYGKSNISNVLNLTRIIRNEENSIASTLGVPFRQFMADWQAYYQIANNRIASSYVNPDNNNLLIDSRPSAKYHQVKISPDGTRVAYSENYRGKYTVFVKNINTGDKEALISGGYHVINQEVDYDLPLINWIDDENLAFIQAQYGSYQLTTYHIPTKEIQKKPLLRFDNIRDFSFNDNGRLAILSADVNGASDLYLISTTRNAIRRLTSDKWDDITPRFLPGRDVIIFSSNRKVDSVGYQMEDVEQVTDNFNLFLYDLDTTTTNYLRLTNTLAKDYYPNPQSYFETYYLSDQKGIFNLYKYSLFDSTFQQVSNFNSSIINYDIHFPTRNIAFTMLDEGQEKIFFYKNFDLNQRIFTPLTLRKEIEQARLLKERLDNTKAETTPRDTIKNDDEVEEEQLPEGEEEFVDTDNYVFEDEIEDRTAENNFSFLSNYRKLEKTTSVSGPFPYDTRFSADNVVTSFVIDPLRGFGILLETSMNDMLENHKFYGGVMAISDLKSGDIFGEYQFLKYRVDFKVRYDRRVILQQTESILQKYQLNKFSVGASLPLTNSLRVDFTPHFAFTRFLDLDFRTLSTTPPNIETDNSVSYIGSETEVVFDNSIVHGLNLYEGTRAKVGFKHFTSMNDNARSFNNFYIDARHYQKIHRELIFATRLFYGKFFGNYTPSYLIGGMDNWLFNSTESTGQNDPLRTETGFDNSKLLFVEYVTNLRGFDYNKFNGTDALLFNAELRFPVFKYFLRGPISSNFFRNFQLVGFYDVGSAWTGASPFKEDNDVNTQFIQFPGSVFEATINNSKSPWLASYGAGLRTVLLGYYMKMDLAWPIEDYTVGSPRFHLTLGYDF